MKWEYKKSASFVDANELGSEGWELVSVSDYFYYKRRTVPPVVHRQLHEVQVRMLEMNEKFRIKDMKLRDLGRLVGVDHPQRVKHHLEQLIRKSLI